MTPGSGPSVPRRARRRLGRWLGKRLLRPAVDRRFRAFVAARRAETTGAFWVIAVPGGVGLLEPCVKLVVPQRPVVLVLNGVAAAERQVIESRLPPCPAFTLPVVPGTCWAHGTVLTLLLRGIEGPFGMLDHDCFVTDPSLFERLEVDADEIFLGVDASGFSRINAATGLRFPRTHWLWASAARLRELMAKHRVTAEKYVRTPRRLAPILAPLGLGDDNFPPDPLRFYDTLQLLTALGFAEGLKVRYLPVSEGGITHFGAATRQLSPF